MTDSFNKLLEQIEIAGRQTADKIKAESDAKAESIVSAAKSETEEYSKNTLAEAEKKAGVIVSRAQAQLEKERRDHLLKVKHDILDSVYSRALLELASLPRTDRFNLYVSWVRRYGEPDEAYEITFNRDDQTDFAVKMQEMCDNGEFPGNPRVSDAQIDCKGGILLLFDDMTKDLTFDALVNDIRENNGDEIAGIVFKGGKL